MKTLGLIGALGMAVACLPGAALGQMDPNAGRDNLNEASRIPQYHKDGASPSPSPGTATKMANISAADANFVNAAAKGGMMEVAMGKTAAKNSKNADVKSFGNRMVSDHSAANNELKAIATRKGIKLPSAGSAPKWSNDKAYMDGMVEDHTKDLAEFKSEASKGTDPDIKAFASKTSKTVAEHLKMAKEIDGKLK